MTEFNALAAMTAALSGKSDDEIANASASASTNPVAVTGASSTELDEEVSYSDPLESVGEGDESSVELEAASTEGDEDSLKVEAPKPSAQKDIEEIFITDDRGKRKITVDFSNREQIKKAYEYAAGFRKMQAERDTLKSIEPKFKEYESTINTLEDVFKKDGVKGIVNLLAAEQGGWDKLVEQELSLRRFKEEASPSELKAWEAEQNAAAARKEADEVRRKLDEVLNRSTEKQEQAEFKALQSVVNPAFDKVRFAGKLNDPVVEHQLDEAIWSRAIKNLESMDDSAVTPAAIEREFRSVAANFRKVIEKQAEARTNQVIQKKKVAAQEMAAAKASSGMRSSAAVDEFKQEMKSGNLTSALEKVLLGKIRL